MRIHRRVLFQPSTRAWSGAVSEKSLHIDLRRLIRPLIPEIGRDSLAAVCGNGMEMRWDRD